MTLFRNLKAQNVLVAALAALCLLAASPSEATITLQSITGVSRADAVVANSTTTKIYGGLAGTGRCVPGSGTCDSCSTVSTIEGLSCQDGTATTACTNYDNTGCNNTMIGPNTIIAVTFTSTTAGFPVAYGSSSTTGTVNQINIQTSGSTPQGISYPAGTLINLRMTWSDMCAQAGCDVASTTLSPGTFTFGIASTATPIAASDPYTVTVTVVPNIAASYEVADATCSTATSGVLCNYIAYPGDSKVTLTSPDAEGAYPKITGSQTIAALRLYYFKTDKTTVDAEISASGADFASITPLSGYAELPVDPSGSVIGNGRVTGLDNDGVYVFKMAHVDQSGNIGLFVANDTGATSDLMCESSTSDHSCHIAQPGAVDGVLAKNINCFIATASYGSPFAPKVQTFRDFRNRYLLNSYLGKKFVHSYYSDFGPRAAGVIRGNETLRAMSRTALFPLWLFAKLSLEIGFFGALLASFGFLILLVVTARVCSQHLRMDA